VYNLPPICHVYVHRMQNKVLVITTLVTVFFTLQLTRRDLTALSDPDSFVSSLGQENHVVAKVLFWGGR
jgi:hypothetical protein